MKAHIWKAIAMVGIAMLLLPAAPSAETLRGTLDCQSGFTGVRIVQITFFCTEGPCTGLWCPFASAPLCPGVVSIFSPSGFSCSSVLDPGVVRNFILSDNCNFSISCEHANVTKTCTRWAEIMYECSYYPGVLKTVCMKVPGSASLVCAPSAAGKIAVDGDATITFQEMLPEDFVTSTCLPPLGNYAAQSPASFAGGIVLNQLELRNIVPCVAAPPAVPGPAISAVHNATLRGQVWLGAVPLPFNVPVSSLIQKQFSSGGGSSQFFETEMLSLNLVGGPLPGGVRLRESPVRASVGVTSMREAVGGYLASSFFDVYVDISTDGGVTWIPATDPAGNPTSVRFLLTADPTDVTNLPVPQRTTLYSCVPNPFNPTTTIEFDLAERGYVQLRILDVLGRVVRTLAHDTLPAGRHEMLWNGTDADGQRLPSGVYISQLKAGDFEETSKMVLVK